MMIARVDATMPVMLLVQMTAILDVAAHVQVLLQDLLLVHIVPIPVRAIAKVHLQVRQLAQDLVALQLAQVVVLAVALAAAQVRLKAHVQVVPRPVVHCVEVLAIILVVVLVIRAVQELANLPINPEDVVEHVMDPVQLHAPRPVGRIAILRVKTLDVPILKNWYD